MKRKKLVRTKVKARKSIFPKNWRRGKIDRGTIFIVVIIICLMFLAFIMVGGTIPETIPKPRSEGIMSVDLSQKYEREEGLQLHTFQGVTITPYPTQQAAVPQPNTTPMSEIACGRGIVGTAKPELIWAYRLAATAASGNAQSIQIFYSGADTLAASTRAMTKGPTDHTVNPPASGTKDPNGFPISPAVFLTDITANAVDVSGDAQNGGTAQFPSDIYGAWRVENALSGTIPNGTNLGPGADLWPAANGPAGGARNSDWTAQNVWKVGNMRTNTGAALVAGNKYRAQIVLHAGTQNKEVAELCTEFVMP